ncbi:ABC transporter substrate-binding protein [Streptomyces sp. SJ1-7]|nr:ABC transporter substrate-binding protein [Streptomyces sp. SJ1-7]
MDSAKARDSGCFSIERRRCGRGGGWPRHFLSRPSASASSPDAVPARRRRRATTPRPPRPARSRSRWSTRSEPRRSRRPPSGSSPSATRTTRPSWRSASSRSAWSTSTRTRWPDPRHQHPVALVKDKWGDTRPEVIMNNGDSGPNYEKIAALRPDLIIAVYSEVDKAAYDKLSRIAPTVGRTKAEKEPFSAAWQDNAVHIAKALGKESEGTELVKGIQDKLDAAKKDNPDFAGQKAVALSWYKGAVYPFTSTDVRGQLVTGSGFGYQTEIDKIADGKFSTELSPERIDLLDVDRIFVINDKADTEALKKFELFANLPAVKNGKVSYLLDSEGPAIGAAMSQGTLLSLPYAIDELVKAAK